MKQRDLPANIVVFPLEAQKARIEREYLRQRQRIDDAEYAGRRPPKPNRRLITEYWTIVQGIRLPD